MNVVAVGTRTLVSGFRLAGVKGIETETAEEALKTIKTLMADKEVGLIIIGDDVAKALRQKLAEIRSKHPVPLIFEVPAPGSKIEKVEYREILRKILGV